MFIDTKFIQMCTQAIHLDVSTKLVEAHREVFQKHSCRPESIKKIGLHDINNNNDMINNKDNPKKSLKRAEHRKVTYTRIKD